jgi:Phosphoesterase family
VWAGGVQSSYTEVRGRITHRSGVSGRIPVCERSAAGASGGYSPADVVVLDVVPADALRAGQPHMVLIEGNAGIGKSSLALESLPRQPGVPVIIAGGEMAKARLACGAVRQLAANPGAETGGALVGPELLSRGPRGSAGWRCRTTRSALLAARSVRTGFLAGAARRAVTCAAGGRSARAGAEVLAAELFGDTDFQGRFMSVEHVVILMLENHSLNEYFGTFPGANGFYSNPESAFANAWVPMPGNWAGSPILPYRLSTFSSQQSHPSRCNHGAAAQHSYYAGGAMNGWSLKSALNPVSCMGYYAADDIPYHWWLAQNFALCDNYYCSVLGPTEPNRIYLMTGTINQYGSRTSCFASELAGGA